MKICPCKLELYTNSWQASAVANTRGAYSFPFTQIDRTTFQLLHQIHQQYSCQEGWNSFRVTALDNSRSDV